jgi:hypothetical protein
MADGGRRLFTRLARGNRHRYETILYFERNWGGRTDYDWLIGPACWILESELTRLLAAPARAIVGDLIAALGRAGDDGPASNLEKWQKTGITTMGVQCQLLLALRRGCEQGVPSVLRLLADHFEPPYAALVRDKRLGQCLDMVGREYRNKACHGLGDFDARAYEEFTRLVLANRRFLEWQAHGPSPDPPGPEAGILHHHLAHARRAGDGAADEDSPTVTRLLALRSPKSPLRVSLRAVAAAAAPATRDVAVTTPAADGVFRLGDRIRFEFSASADGHVTLIDVGTSGAVTVIRPNAWHRDTSVEANRSYSLPNATAPEFDYRLTGRLGVERVAALLTRQPLPAGLLLPDAGQGTRRLTDEEVERVVSAVEQLPAAEWAAAVSEFAIEA